MPGESQLCPDQGALSSDLGNQVRLPLDQLPGPLVGQVEAAGENGSTRGW